MPSFRTLVKFHLYIVIGAVAFYYFKSFRSSSSTAPADTRLFTVQELATYDSSLNDEEIYLSILGSVYDVTKGKKHYGRGCSYGFFTGKDASLGFLTGEPSTADSDDLAEMKPADALSLFTWKKFYEEQYIFKGKLIERFYDKNGEPTTQYKKIEALAKIGEDEKQQKQQLKELFPACNIEWKEDTGTRVWCSTASGGVRRDWVGVPRKYFELGETSFRCACVREQLIHSAHLKPYEDCKEDATECFYRLE